MCVRVPKCGGLVVQVKVSAHFVQHYLVVINPDAIFFFKKNSQIPPELSTTSGEVQLQCIMEPIESTAKNEFGDPTRDLIFRLAVEQHT
jgi:hypothetical protein